MFLGWGWLKLLAAIGGVCRLFEAISGFGLGVMAVNNGNVILELC